MPYLLFLKRFMTASLGVGWGIFLLIYPAYAQEASGLSANIIPCIPQENRQPISQIIPISETEFQGQTYHLLSVYFSSDPHPSNLIIASTYDSCQEVFYNPMGDAIALSQVVPQEVAQQLTLGRYQREIERIGLDAFQQQVSQSAPSRESVTWAEEEVWALQQLGIEIPSNVQVSPP
jgi:hypothetical protein